MELRIAHLYAELMNIYGDRGNVLVLRKRSLWRGITCHVTSIGLGELLDWQQFDLFFLGGGQDRHQHLMARDLQSKRDALFAAVADRRPLLAVCGGYQLLGHRYREADGAELAGIGLFDAETEHPGLTTPRCVGNVVVACEWAGIQQTLVGFENHGGRTFLGSNSAPLGRVIAGFGNNGKDGYEGARAGTAYGTYLHGSLLPKNPWFADHLLSLALQRRYGADAMIQPLDDRLEDAAHRTIVLRCTQRHLPWIRKFSSS
ncbi:MAG: glutamine amidotransferase [Chloroflexi bacterium]|nr:glutamine amidotransferase [Chloroflexota bacterium]